MYHYDLELLAALKIQFPANVPGEVSENGPSTWALPPMWKTWMESDILALAWVSPCYCSHVKGELIGGRSVFLLVSNKQINNL